VLLLENKYDDDEELLLECSQRQKID